VELTRVKVIYYGHIIKGVNVNTSIDVKIKGINSMTVAFINVKGDFSQNPMTFQKLNGWIAQKGYEPIGPSIAIYYNIPGRN